MIGYEILSKTIKKMKLLPLFGNPGTTEIPLLEGINEDDYILTLHDSISVGMADGRAQITREPSFVNLHSILGIGNSMAFIYSAYVDKVPMIITAGEQDSRHIFYDPLLSGNINDMISPYVKYKFEMKSADDIERSIKRSYISSMTPPYSISFLGFPMDIMEQEGKYYELNKPNVNSDVVDINAVKYIAEIINNSKNPVIVTGYELDMYKGIKYAIDLVDKLGIPIFAEPFASRAPFDSSNKNYAGDLPPVAAMINQKLADYDLILLIGGDINLYPYTDSDLLQGKKIIKVGLDISGKIGDSYFMNPSTFLYNVINYIKSKKPSKIPQKPAIDVKSQIQRVMLKISRCFPDYTIVDESVSASPFLRNIIGYKPDSYFIGKSGQIGWALPAAAGMATVNNKILCIIGDGSFMYSVQTLWTIKKYNLPVKIIILNNNGYGILKKFSYANYNKSKKYLEFNIELKKIVDSFNIESQENDETLKDINWLHNFNGPAALIVNVDKPYGYNLFG